MCRYDTGTDFWGLLNPDWTMCNSGKRQSPINIDPTNLLFDPDLRAIRMDDHRVSGILENNGHSIIFRIQDESGGYHSLTSMDDSSSLPAAAALLSSSSSSILRSSGSQLRPASSSPPSSGDLVSSSPADVSVTGGPFSYTYHIDSIYLHFGRTDLHGSEHVVAGISFPAEVRVTLPPSPYLTVCCPPSISTLAVIGGHYSLLS